MKFWPFCNMSLRAPDLIIGDPANPYLLRWHLIPKNRLLNIYLHKFLRSDDDRALHDHPWASCSVILKGGYAEYVPTGLTPERIGAKIRMPGHIVLRRASQAHRIKLFIKGWWADAGRGEIPAWTLFITGPKIREWGFHCPKGWRHWREFIGLPSGEPRGDEVGKGCE